MFWIPATLFTMLSFESWSTFTLVLVLHVAREAFGSIFTRIFLTRSLEYESQCCCCCCSFAHQIEDWSVVLYLKGNIKVHLRSISNYITIYSFKKVSCIMKNNSTNYICDFWSVYLRFALNNSKQCWSYWREISRYKAKFVETFGNHRSDITRRFREVAMYVRTYACMYVCMYVCMFVCTYVRMYVCMYVCM